MLGDRSSQALLRKKREAAKRRPSRLRSLHGSAMPSEWEVYRGLPQVSDKFAVARSLEMSPISRIRPARALVGALEDNLETQLDVARASLQTTGERRSDAVIQGSRIKVKGASTNAGANSARSEWPAIG